MDKLPMKENALSLPEKEYLLPGNRSCAGCGLSLAYRYILKALEGRAVITVTASCLTVLQGMYPLASVNVPSINTPFASVAAGASGLVAGLRSLGRDDLTVVGFAGDGGTSDIGIQSLSGAAARQTDFLYICYDNEGYMNTGTQHSSSTPFGAITTTTPIKGKRYFPKDMPKIMEAHNLPYIFTASSSFPIDLYQKVSKCRNIRGTKYGHVHIPCPPGWSFPTSKAVKIGKLAVETGMVVLYEIENGVLRLTSRSKQLAKNGNLKLLDEYISHQIRFAKLTGSDKQRIQDWINQRWQQYLARDIS